MLEYNYTKRKEASDMSVKLFLDIIHIGLTGAPTRVETTHPVRQTVSATPSQPMAEPVVKVDPTDNINVQPFNYWVDDVLRVGDFAQVNSYALERELTQAGFPVSSDYNTRDHATHMWFVGANNTPNVDMQLSDNGWLMANGRSVTRGQDLLDVFIDEIKH